MGSLGWGQEEWPIGVLAKVVDQNPEAAFAVTEPLSGFFITEVFDKIGSERLILTMDGVFGFKKDPGQVSYLFS